MVQLTHKRGFSYQGRVHSAATKIIVLASIKTPAEASQLPGTGSLTRLHFTPVLTGHTLVPKGLRSASGAS